jgi:hypothetical protein
VIDPLDLLRGFAFVGIPSGLVLGLLLGVVANRPDGWGGYGSFPRRAARLGHVAAVMLPALGGLYAVLLEGAARGGLLAAAAWTWLGGAVLLVTVLFGAARRPAVRYLLPLPALALTAAAVVFALVHLQGPEVLP